ncbi:MAG: LacI family transcriptional regulator [bacterium]|nr:LacI family transcriptional regulator [bacterium]
MPINSTIWDVAKKAGVSISTVSKALNNRAHVNPKTRELVKQVAKQLKYHPSAFGRGLVLQKTGNIGFIIDRTPLRIFSNPFHSRVLDGIEEELLRQDYNLLISAHSLLDNKETVPKFVREKNVDGLILSGKIADKFILEIYQWGIPLVLVDNHIPQPNIDCVVTDNINGAKQAVNHLIELGHKKIGMLTGIGKHVSIIERRQGYFEAMKSANLTPNPKWIAEGDVTTEGGMEAMEKLFAQTKELPTALFAFNDAMATGAMKVLRAHQIRVPEDISIVGFDDTDEAIHVIPPLTTVHVAKEEMGRIAAQLLISRIQRKKDVRQRVVLTTHLVIRESTRRI